MSWNDAKAANLTRSLIRNFPWPIRKKIVSAPALHDLTVVDDLELCILSTRKTQLDAAWSAYSYCRSTGSRPKINFVVDPAPDKWFKPLVNKLFPNNEVLACSNFRKSEFTSAISRFCATFQFGGKLATIIELSTRGNLLYMDSDVMFFKRPNDIVANIIAGAPFYMVGGGGLDWNSPKLLKYMEDLGVAPIVGFNSGLMYFPSGSLDAEIFENALSTFGNESYQYFTEQTLFNLFFATKPSLELNKEMYFTDGDARYIFTSDINYKDTVARHFVGPFRHQLYLRGMGLLRKRLFRAHSWLR